MKIVLFVLSIVLLISFSDYSQEYSGRNADLIISGADQILLDTFTSIPAYLEFNPKHRVLFDNFKSWIKINFHMNDLFEFRLFDSFSDALGYKHYRFQEYYSGYLVDKAIYIVHTLNGKVVSMNGRVFNGIQVELRTNLSDHEALSIILGNIKAEKYIWDAQKTCLSGNTNNLASDSSYLPKGDLVLVRNTKKPNSFKLAYKFDIYSIKPIARSWYYIDAIEGQILFKEDIISFINSKGTAYTKYSSKQNIITDSISPYIYRLRENCRGMGINNPSGTKIETYNMHQKTDYSCAVDFIDSNNTWNQFNANKDEVATDAHWNAEMTYDYYWTKFGRNSFNSIGSTLANYVHYDSAFDNAFWNGANISYGDGSAGTPFTLLDFTAHEFTHGVISFTAGLNGQEGMALNESFCDIFGKSVEYFARPSQFTWVIGDNVIPLRDLSDPKAFNYPDCYKGKFWDSLKNVSHINSMPQSHCFYLLCNGGSGTNDLGNYYNVTGIGREKAEMIFYRTLTIYLVPTSNYSDSRYYSIKSAIDLFGNCSPEVRLVNQAWYAVGVGSPKFKVDFTIKQYMPNCFKNYNVDFINKSDSNAVYDWDFGDGSTETGVNVSHTYKNYGVYNVKLTGYSVCDTDSIVYNKLIRLDTLNTCAYLIPKNIDSTDFCQGILLDDGGTQDYGSNVNGKFSIHVKGAKKIMLRFKSFSFTDCGMLDCDYIKIFDGSNISSPLIGKYTGNSLPGEGVIQSSQNSITVQEITKGLYNKSGFVMNWQCSDTNQPPLANFGVFSTYSCQGTVNFYDNSANNPISWKWDFGDGEYSYFQNPAHTFKAEGLYTIKLIVANFHGIDSIVKSNYIKISYASILSSHDTALCNSGSTLLSAEGFDHINWYSSERDSDLILFDDPTFYTPKLYEDRSYWVQGFSNPVKLSLGPTDTSFGPGRFFNDNIEHFEIFDAEVELKLVSVKVYAFDSGYRKIKLSNPDGAIIKDTSVLCLQGSNRVVLNFDVPAKKKLRLGSSTHSNFYANTDKANYQYTRPGVASIYESDLFPNQFNCYFYFYDWKIEYVPCRSIKKRINILIDSHAIASVMTI